MSQAQVQDTSETTSVHPVWLLQFSFFAKKRRKYGNRKINEYRKEKRDRNSIRFETRDREA